MKVKIRLGALSPPLHEQLGVDVEATEQAQKCADAITLLHIVGFLTDSETHRSRKRLIKSLEKGDI